VRGFSLEALSLLILSIEAVWDKEFASITKQPNLIFSKDDLGDQMYASPPTQQVKSQTPQDADELARTAGLLIESVRDEQNPKFQNSQFMGLMKQLRDHEVVVEGDKMVESGFGISGARWANDFQIDVKGKGKAVDMPTQEMDPNASSEQLDARRAFRSFPRTFSPSRGEIQSLADNQTAEETVVYQEEDANDAYFRQENAEYTQYWNAHHNETAEHVTVAMNHTSDWDRMQRQWDLFEATATGIKPVDNYQFQENNPYLLGDRSGTRHHMMHLNERQSFFEVCLVWRFFVCLKCLMPVHSVPECFRARSSCPTRSKQSRGLVRTWRQTTRKRTRAKSYSSPSTRSGP
jgi:peroxin-5